MTASSDVAETSGPDFAEHDVMAKSASENFSVASRLLPRRYRDHLLALYGYARFVDDIGDLSDGDRIGQLKWAESELRRGLAGAATHPVFVRAGATARTLGIDERPFLDLIAANLQDQDTTRYRTFEDLEAYCNLSASPVGRMVLSVFGSYRPDTVTLSDQICIGLQLVEHWQDVGEDLAAGRIYIPADDLDRFGVAESDLSCAVASPAVRRLMAFEVTRARRLLESGRPLVAKLPPAGRIAISGFIGGGLANLDAIESNGFDVLSARCKAGKGAMVRRSLAVLSSRTGSRS